MVWFDWVRQLVGLLNFIFDHLELGGLLENSVLVVHLFEDVVSLHIGNDHLLSVALQIEELGLLLGLLTCKVVVIDAFLDCLSSV